METLIFENFEKLNNFDFNIEENLLLENDSLTYYELRRFVTMLFKMTNDKDAKKVIGEILKSLAVMELRKVPVPTVRKLKANSPKIFGG